MTDEIKKRLDQVKNSEIPEGYQKKFSLAPVKWSEYRLSELCKKNIEKNKDLKYDIVLSNTAAQGVIRQSDYFEKDIANEENIDTYFIVKDKNFVYNPRISSLAPYGPIHANELGIDGIVSPLYTVFSLENRAVMVYEYLKFYFDSSQWNQYMYSVANYGARYDRMNIGDKDFFNLSIYVPTRVEQKRIVEILTYCNKVIDLKKQLIAEEHKQKKWLADRFFMKTKLHTQTLGDLCYVTMGQSPDSRSYNSVQRGLPLIQGNADIENRISNPRNYTTEPAKTCEASDILLSVRAPVGMVAKSNMRACIGRGVCAIKPKKDLEYIYQFLLYFEDKWAKISQGSTFDAVSGDEIRKIAVPISGDMNRVANILSTADRKIELLEQELEQWQLKKKSLMQLLLTGIVRVDV